MKLLKNSKCITKIAAGFTCIAAAALIGSGIYLAHLGKEAPVKKDRQNVATEEKSAPSANLNEISAVSDPEENETNQELKGAEMNTSKAEGTDTSQAAEPDASKTTEPDTAPASSKTGKADASDTPSSDNSKPDLSNTSPAEETNISKPEEPDTPKAAEPDTPDTALPNTASTDKTEAPSSTQPEAFGDFPVIEPDIFLPEDSEVSFSLELQRNLGILAKAITFRNHCWDDAMGEGYSYPTDSVQANMEVIDILSLCALFDPSYLNVLPSMETDPNASVYNVHYERYFDPEEMRLYMKNVFGIENANMAPYCIEDKVVSYLFTDFPLNKFELQNAVLLPDGTYEITGNGVVFTDLCAYSYPFCMVVKENADSPFGFQLISIDFYAMSERAL